MGSNPALPARALLFSTHPDSLDAAPARPGNEKQPTWLFGEFLEDFAQEWWQTLPLLWFGIITHSGKAERKVANLWFASFANSETADGSIED